jgi:choice-of-anchor B domain-containing protein
MFRTLPRTAFLAIVGLVCFPVAAQLNMSLVGQLSYQDLRNSDISDIWGYVDEQGNEYALVGVNGGGVSVVSLAVPSAPVEIFYFPGPGSIWRDLKVWNDHAYVTTEGGGGLAIVDLSPLPESNALTAQTWTTGGWGSAHNLYIDENGIAYISGADRGNGGVIFLDLTIDPFEPVEVGEFDNWYSHDCMVRGDTMYAAHISDGFFSIVDVSDKQSPVLLGTQNTGNNFTHNCWVSDDGDYLYTTDEVTGGWLGSYDISDPTDIQELQLFQSDPGSLTIPHNTHFINEYVVTSYYRLGTTIHDVSRPWNVVEVARYDHCDFVGDNYNGGWGTYPWLPSGRIISSDIEEGLIVLDAEYVRACWLEGVITNAVTGAPVQGATVVLSAPSLIDVTAFDGVYATGSHQAGTHQVTVSAPGYVTATIADVELVNGQLTLLDVALQPLESFAMGGAVVDAFSGAGIPDAQVRFSSEDLNYEATASGSGTYVLPNVFNGTYELGAARWGWIPTCSSDITIDPSVVPYSIELEPGYADDMSFDLGWTVTGTATIGSWERAVPEGMTLNGQVSNPASDASGDCGDAAYVTGPLAGVSAGDFDLDGGYTELRSPIFDATGMSQPAVRYHRWFVNGGGSGSPNDRLVISISNGTNTAVVETVQASVSAWISRSFNILDHVAATDQMTFIAYAVDDAPGHVVEAGIDRFEVVDLATVGIPVVAETSTFALWPNPSSGQVNVMMPAPGRYGVEVIDATGRLVQHQDHVQDGMQHLQLTLGVGAYLVRVTNEQGERSARSILVVH